MSKPLRLEFSGALYHVASRGDRRKAIYEDDERIISARKADRDEIRDYENAPR